MSVRRRAQVEWKVPVNSLEEKNMWFWLMDFVVFPSQTLKPSQWLHS